MKVKLSGKRRALNVIVLILSAICILFGSACLYLENMMNNIHYEVVEEGDLATIVSAGDIDFNFGNISDGSLYQDEQVMNIALLSLDNYYKEETGEDSGRSDSMMLFSIDNRRKKIKLTSYMRDLYLDIPGYGFNRLNAAYSFGGPSLTLATMENNFRVNVDRYILIDYYKFVEIIDTVGGVDIEISQDEADIINDEADEEEAPPVAAGMAHMTGRQARMYSRIRKIDSDFERTARQRKVVTALIEKLRSVDLLTLNSYVSDILSMITTNLSKDEVLGLAGNIMSYVNYDIESFRLPTQDGYYDYTTADGAMVLVPYLKTCVDQFVKFLYEDQIPTLTETYTLPQYGGITENPDAAGTADTSNLDNTIHETITQQETVDYGGGDVTYNENTYDGGYVYYGDTNNNDTTYDAGGYGGTVDYGAGVGGVGVEGPGYYTEPVEEVPDYVPADEVIGDGLDIPGE